MKNENSYNVLKLYNEGIYNNSEIARKLNISRTAVGFILKSNGIFMHAARSKKIDEEKIITDYLSGKSATTLSKENKIDKRIIKGILLKNNVRVRDYIYSEEDVKNIIELYNQGKTALAIAKENKNYKIATIERILRKNVKVRNNHIKHKFLDLNFWEDINTEHKAYILGLIFADGWVGKNTVDISLSKNDKKLLQDISYFLYGKDLTHDRKRKNLHFKKYNISEKQYTNLCLGNKNTVNIFKIYGCLPKKSLIVNFNDYLFNKLKYNGMLNHFIRGYFDGDGCAFLAKNIRGSRIEMIGARPFLEKISNYFAEIGIDFYFNKYKANENIMYLIVLRQSSVIKLIDLFYQNSSIYLERKFLKCQEIKKEYIKRIELKGKNARSKKYTGNTIN